MDKKVKNPTFLLTLSVAFEYYDFVIYALMSGYLGALFFPNSDPFIAKLQAFAVFTLGYIIRPLGGVLLGAFGDLTNRREVFIRSNFILALATLGMAFLPTYEQIGISATIILILLRIMQALTFAAELPGSMAIIEDTTKQPNKNFSFIVSGAAVGAMLASTSLALIEESFSREQILNFAWRAPFVLGAILCLISLVMRKRLPSLNQEKPPILRNWLEILFPQCKAVISFVLLIAIIGYLVIMNLFFPSLLPQFYGFKEKDIYIAISLSLAWSIFYAPIFAHYTNKFSRITLMQIMIVATILSSLFINFLFNQGSNIALLAGLCLYQSLISGLMVSVFPLMAQTFPSKVRFTLMGLCYNSAYSLMAFIPILVIDWAKRMESPLLIWLGLITISILALANMSGIYKDKN